MSSGTPVPLPTQAAARRLPRLPHRGRVALHVFLLGAALLWLFPLLWALYTSLRPYAETAERGYVSPPGRLTLDNYAIAWRDGELLQHFLNTLVIVVPSVVLVLGLAAMLAFAVSRFSWGFNVALLMFFTAGNLLPPHVLITPLFRLFLALPVPPPLSDNGVLYDQHLGVILAHVSFQLGFCTFVLSAYMKTIPQDILEAARLDGASVGRLLRSIILPLSRPVIAALATLEATWIYNDFLWALVLMQTADKRPVTTALANLSGEFFTDHNVVAATAMLIALPTLLLFLFLRRHFTRGLGLTSGGG
ncbi:MAG TPA: carbohydrate ABC transporter permease [Candidatus Limnocylindria bacterium]|nr:carbohydrate ABC transporter permease [Candidatus Limnocylindria bacterium]